MIPAAPLIDDDERRRRLVTRHLLVPGAAASSVSQAAAAVTCLHATEMASMVLSAAVRAGASRADVRAAQERERTLQRQLAMRRTVFAFPVDLLPAVWGSASARVARAEQRRLVKELGDAGISRDPEEWVTEQCAAVEQALADHGPLTVAAIREAVPELERRVVRAAGTRYETEVTLGRQVLAVLGARGRVVRGVEEGTWRTSRPRWELTRSWLPGVGEPLDEAAGYAVLVERWLRTFGPGTEEDIVWWLGATKSAVRRALADVGAVPVRLESGAPAFVLGGDDGATPDPDPHAALLPALDPATMGWKGRDFYLGEHRDLLFDRNGNGGPTAWWAGRIVGGWTQDDDGRVVVVPVVDLPRAAQRALAEKAEELTGWFEGEVLRPLYQSPVVRARARGERPG